VRVPVKSNRALVKAEDNFIDDVFEADEGKGAGGWVLPPSLMAVAAVPGAPVINTQADTRVPKDVKEEVREMDPYLRFMPVPAVPDPAINTQAPRQPKDSLNSLDLNTVKAETQPKKAETRKSQRKRPTPNPSTRRPSTKAPANKAPKVKAENSRVKTADDKKEARKKFKRCHGRCVQQFCLPATASATYENCVAKCKSFCT